MDLLQENGLPLRAEDAKILVVEAAQQFPATSVLDDFNRADEGPPPSGWTATLRGGWKISGNKAVANDPGADIEEGCQWEGGTYSSAIELYAKIVQTSLGGGNTELHWHRDVSGNGYILSLDAFGDPRVLYRVRVYRSDGGVDTQLGSTIDRGGQTPIAFGVRHEPDGTIRVYTDEGSGWVERGTVSDTTYNSGKFRVLIAGNWQLDDFGGGTI